LIGHEYEARLVWQNLVQGLKEPVADLFDKSIGQGKANARCYKRIDKAAAQVC
jgi:hypothetical protein